MYAIINSIYEAIPFLLESGFSPDEISGTDTALSIACFFGMQDLKTYQLLCQYSKNLDLPPSMHCGSAVHWICQTSNPDIVRIFLQYPIDVNRTNEKEQFGPELLQDPSKDQPSIEDKNIEIMEMLVQHNFDINNKKSNGIPWYDKFLGMINLPLKQIAWCLKHGVDIDTPTSSKEGKTIREVLRRARFRDRLKEDYNIIID